MKNQKMFQQWWQVSLLMLMSHLYILGFANNWDIFSIYRETVTFSSKVIESTGISWSFTLPGYPRFLEIMTFPILYGIYVLFQKKVKETKKLITLPQALFLAGIVIGISLKTKLTITSIANLELIPIIWLVCMSLIYGAAFEVTLFKEKTALSIALGLLMAVCTIISNLEAIPVMVLFFTVAIVFGFRLNLLSFTLGTILGATFGLTFLLACLFGLFYILNAFYCYYARVNESIALVSNE